MKNIRKESMCMLQKNTERSHIDGVFTAFLQFMRGIKLVHVCQRLEESVCFFCSVLA